MISYFPSAGGLKKAILEYGTIAYVLSTPGTSAKLYSIKSDIKAIFNYSTNDIVALTYASMPHLELISAPYCIAVGYRAFEYCASLAKVNLLACETISYGAFKSCYNLTSILLPNCTTIGGSATSTFGAFYGCTKLSTISLPNVSTIGPHAFNGCTALSAIYLMASSVCLLSESAFNGTPIKVSSYLGFYGSIYVPSSLLTAYQTATNWKTISDRIVGI